MLRLIYIVLAVFCSFGCAMSPLANDPNEVLFVMRTNLPAYATVYLKNIGTGERISVKLRYMSGESYLAAGILPGRYQITNYKPFVNVDIPLENMNITFVISANCAHYYGYLSFYGQEVSPGRTLVTSESTLNADELKTIAPGLKRQFIGHDLCVPGVREAKKFSWESVRAYFE